jgi:hypothetical protein
MIVIPTEKRVTLTYGVSTADWIGRVSTGLGVIGLGWLGLTRQAALSDITPATSRRRRRSRNTIDPHAAGA